MPRFITKPAREHTSKHPYSLKPETALETYIAENRKHPKTQQEGANHNDMNCYPLLKSNRHLGLLYFIIY